mgnify:CR=1 FL=1
MITIFTDGASRGNPGPGGWGSIVSLGEKVTELGGSVKNTTNNRMELTAVIRALDYVHKTTDREHKTQIFVFTDSTYVKKGASEWLFSWKKNNWKTKNKKDVLNKDLWEELSTLLEKFNIEFKFLPGHSNIPANERCDEIATSFADGFRPKLYEGPKQDYKISLDTKSKFPKSPPSGKQSSNKAYSYLSMLDGIIMKHDSWVECEKRVRGVSGAKYKKAMSLDQQKSIIKEWQKNFQ